MECDRIFVYGTLRKGVRPDIHQRYLGDQAEFLGDGTVAGRLWRVDWYPALTEGLAADERVLGEVYRLLQPTESIAELDRFEVCDLKRPEASEYTRRIVAITLGNGSETTAWCYYFLGAVDGLQRLKSGDFAGESV